MAKPFVPYDIPKCPPDPEDPETPPAPVCPDWTLCLPFGGKLYAQDGCVYCEKGSPPADGVYGKIVIAGGCIVGAEPLEACVTQIAPCLEAASPCGETSEGAVAPSKAAGNLYTLDAAGYPLVRCSISGGEGINITGNGTANDPFVISASYITLQTFYVVSENDAIAVHGSGSYANPFALAHKSGKQGKFGALTFDEYGHLIDTGEGSANAGVAAVVGGNGVKATTDYTTNMVTVGLEPPTKNKSGKYSLGGYEVSVDEFNRIFDIQREITLEEATYALGAYLVSVTGEGSIAEIADNPQGAGVNFLLRWDADAEAKTATFNLPFPTMLGGEFYAPSGVSGFSVRIDTVAATVSFDRVFSCPAIFGAGLHTISVTHAGSGGVAIMLRALSSPVV